MIKVVHLSHNFGTCWALKDCTFTLGSGEFLFLSGPSGAGKTTLLRLLYGALPIQRGEAHVADFTIHNLQPREVPLLRRQVSVVFQDFKILPDRTVRDNIALALEVQGLAPLRIDRRVRAVSKALSLEAKLHNRCAELSGGEQQRVAVARAAVVNPQVLLADEPTGNLDPDLSLRLMDLFMKFQAHGTTVILATHSLELLRRHPKARLLRLEDGMVTYANWPGALLFHRADAPPESRRLAL
jgi:cell division transport system ATP-binding protein